MRFADRVYDIVRRIPRGRVATYGDIAAMLGRDRGAREVGWALAACHDGRTPCHRVVDRTGLVARAFPRQRTLLADEGVLFVSGRVRLDRHRWRPRIAPR